MPWKPIKHTGIRLPNHQEQVILGSSLAIAIVVIVVYALST